MAVGSVPMAVLLGLMSAGAFAASNALQHRVAGTVPADVDRALRVLAFLARRPLWLAATTISLCAVLLHATALRHGSISLVQPLMLVGVVLAVPLRAALELQTPTWREVRAVLVTMTGLGALLWCAAPAPSDARPSPGAAVVLVLAGIGAAVCVLRASKRIAGRPRALAAALGATAGVMFGLTAGLLKVVGSAVATGRTTDVVPAAVGLVCAGVLGTAMNQRAYQLAPLSVSMPLVNVVDVVVAVFFGAVVLHELPGHRPDVLLVQAAALGCLAVGLRQIARLESLAPRTEAVADTARCGA